MADFLRLHNLDLVGIKTFLESAEGLQEGDLCFASGSVADGLGTPWSDLDVYLITERAISGRTFGQVTVLDCGSLAIDLEVWNRSVVESLITRLEFCPSTQERDERHALAFSVVDRELLHRIYVGFPLFGEEAFKALKRRIDPIAISRIIFDRAATRIISAQTDLLGLFETQDCESALFLSQTLLGFTAEALLAAVGNTNPSDKWRIRLLHKLDNRGLNLPGGPVEKPAALFWTLHNPRDLTPRGLREHACDTVRLSNRIIPWGQQRFLNSDNCKLNADSQKCEALNNSRKSTSTTGRILPRLSLKAVVRLQNRKLCLLSLGERGVFEISGIAHEALLLFDGRTSVGQAVDELSQHTPASKYQLEQSLQDVEEFLRDHNLIDCLE